MQRHMDLRAHMGKISSVPPSLGVKDEAHNPAKAAQKKKKAKALAPAPEPAPAPAMNRKAVLPRRGPASPTPAELRALHDARLEEQRLQDAFVRAKKKEAIAKERWLKAQNREAKEATPTSAPSPRPGSQTGRRRLAAGRRRRRRASTTTGSPRRPERFGAPTLRRSSSASIPRPRPAGQRRGPTSWRRPRRRRPARRRISTRLSRAQEAALGTVACRRGSAAAQRQQPAPPQLRRCRPLAPRRRRPGVDLWRRRVGGDRGVARRLYWARSLQDGHPRH